MSFSSSKRNNIQAYLLEKIAERDPDAVKKTALNFDISVQTIYRYIRSLMQEGALEKKSGKYALRADTFMYLIQDEELRNSEEYTLYTKYIWDHVSVLPRNVSGIWDYACSEMLNNVLDHSNADQLGIFVRRTRIDTTIILTDNGVGIFSKIRDYYQLPSLQDAVLELFKGRLTTDVMHHSGEGIFFSSRLVDTFAVISDNHLFTHDRHFEIADNLNSFPSLSRWADHPGTIVYMKLSNSSKRCAKDVFDSYADIDGGFVTTLIPIRNVFNGIPVSRSQAKRLYRRFEKFKKVIIDFEDVDEIGQGFAHELFVVFNRNFPSTKIEYINANETVERMILHAINGA